MKNIKLNYVHLCDTAFLSDSGKVNIIGLFKVIFAQNFPTMHPKLSLVASVGFEEALGSHNAQIKFIRTSDSKEIMDNPINVNFEINDSRQEFNFIGDLVNITFEQPGNYEIKIFIDGKEIGNTFFDVIKK